MFSRVPHLFGLVREKTHNIVHTEGQKPGRLFSRAFIIRRTDMKWIFLLLAGLLEIAWAVGLKYSEGFSRLLPSAVTVICMIASFYFLSLALKELPLGAAYAVWTGIGTLGTVILGIAFFGEPCTALRLLCIFCITAGIAGLKLTTH